jgi:hypothetical protein
VQCAWAGIESEGEIELKKKPKPTPPICAGCGQQFPFGGYHDHIFYILCYGCEGKKTHFLSVE